MVRSIYTAATGMEAQQLYMDVISNNLSNVNTNGFKRSKVEFQDLLYQTLKEPGVRNPEGEMCPSGIEVGLGVKSAATNRIFEQGSLNLTGNELDIAIGGEGFFQIELPDGAIAYTRDGQFKSDANGTIVTTDGYRLSPEVTLPEGAQNLKIGDDGTVRVLLNGDTEMTDVGNIEIARFINPSGLKAIGGNLFEQTEASGEALVGNPVEDGAGKLMPGYVEASNVRIVDEMVNMITAQRAFEIVSKSIQVSEEMMQTANNLKR